MADDRRRRAFIGSFTAAGGPGIVTADVDPGSGALTATHHVDTVPDPSYLALAPDGGTLYAVSETTAGTVTAFRLAAGGPEPAGPPVPVAGEAPTHLGLYGRHVLTANYGSGSVSAVPVRPDGTLAAAPSGVLRHTGPAPERSPRAHQVQPDPSGRWAVSVDLGTDSVRVCTLVDGAPAVHRETPLRPGSGPRHLAFHPDGGHAYVVNELAPTVTVCRWDAAEGALHPFDEVPVLPDTPAGDAYPSGVAVSADGRFVWTATRGEDVLSVFAVGPGGGLELLTTVPCGGHWPRALTAFDGVLYVANERSGDVTWFAVDPGSGTPRRAGSLAVAAASCVLLG